MAQVIGHTDIAAMLAAFERSDFERLAVQAGSTRVTASRTFSKPDDPPASAGRDIVTVAAPMLGIFHAGLEADPKPLVRPGDLVGEDTVIGAIRVRRKLNPVKARRRGRVAAILVRDGDFVEYGQALLELDPAEIVRPGGEG